MDWPIFVSARGWQRHVMTRPSTASTGTGIAPTSARLPSMTETTVIRQFVQLHVLERSPINDDRVFRGGLPPRL